jgi:FCD domain/ANTAR domain
MADSARHSAAAQPRDPTELRLLIELPALRKLADRGLSDGELAITRQLASATMRPALSGDVTGYLQADTTFHLYLLELTGDPTLSQVARLLLTSGAEYRPRDAELGRHMAAGAMEHREIVNLLADDMVNAAEDLLRHHVARHGVRCADNRRSDPARRPADAGRGHASGGVGQADLDAFFRRQGDIPLPSPAELTDALSRLPGSDDPVVTFARLARSCVPAFADACQVELSDGKEPLVRVRHPASPADGLDQAEAQAAGPHPILLTPFRVASRTGYPSYAGVMTHWWAGRAPTEADAVIADLMVKHAIALVDGERLMAAVAQAEDRAASLALESISGRVMSLATGIVMHQRGLSPDDAEDVLRQAATTAGSSLPAVAVNVVHSGSLDSSLVCGGHRVPVRLMAPVRPDCRRQDRQPGPSVDG